MKYILFILILLSSITFSSCTSSKKEVTVFENNDLFSEHYKWENNENYYLTQDNIGATINIEGEIKNTNQNDFEFCIIEHINSKNRITYYIQKLNSNVEIYNNLSSYVDKKVNVEGILVDIHTPHTRTILINDLW